MLTKTLDVFHNVRRGVHGQIDVRTARKRKTAPTASLIEQNCAKGFGIEETPGADSASRTGTAVEVENRNARRIADCLPVETLTIRHFQQPRLVRLDGRVQDSSHRR